MSFESIIERIKNNEDGNPVPLIDLVNETGIHKKNKSQHVANKLKDLTTLLNNHQDQADTIRNYVIRVFGSYNPLTLYTDAGILPGHGFFSEAYKRLKYKLLPPLQNTSHTQYLLRQVFYKKKDYQKIAGLDESVWLQLIDAIAFDADILKWSPQNLNYLLNALMVLSQRITAIGLEPDVVDKLPQTDDLQSPFFGLYREVQNYVDCFKTDTGYIRTNEQDYLHILVMCSQCTDSIDELHKHKEKYGISIHLAYLMLRLEQHVKRLSMILKLIQTKDQSVFNKTILDFMYEVVHAENRKYSVSSHLNENLRLIAYKITEHTSRVGEHYKTADRREYFTMFKSAMGGGFIVSLIVLCKIFAHHLLLPPFWEAFANSMIYATGFILIHLFHFTLATKQPAMTANTIAASLDETEKADKKKLKTVKLIAEISRAQFISLVGNILIVLPASFMLGLLYNHFRGSNILSDTEAQEMMMNLHPWLTGSLFYAALAGVFLMSSALIAGYYDNKVIFGRIPERIQQHPFLIRLFSENQLQTIANYCRNNAGLLFGNLFLGIFLATAPFIGKLLGLPFDVRHVTLSTGNFGLALQNIEQPIPTHLLIEICLSLLLMGFINLLVSFGLAIYVAARSRSLSTGMMHSIVRAILSYFLANPHEFIIPPGKKEQTN